jgi:hypothetical protein
LKPIDNEVHEDHEEKQDLALPMPFTRRVRRQKPRLACLSVQSGDPVFRGAQERPRFGNQLVGTEQPDDSRLSEVRVRDDAEHGDDVVRPTQHRARRVRVGDTLLQRLQRRVP